MSTAKELQHSIPIVKGHVDAYSLVSRHFMGETAVVRDHWVPAFREAGLNIILLAVSGDRLSMLGGSERPLHAALQIMDMLLMEFEALRDPEVSIITTRAELDHARSRAANGHVAFILALEGGRPLQGYVGHLRSFYRLGVRYFQITHDLRNDLADGRREGRTGGRLSRFGRQVVEEVGRLGMVLDLSHISHPGFWDAIELTEGPVMVSHANARAVWDHPRNFDDEELEALAAKDGVIGVHYLVDFIGPHFEPIEGVMTHVNHIVSVIGTEHVAISGLGLDAREMALFADAPWPYQRNAEILARQPQGIYFDTQYERFIQTMLDAGYSEDDISLILGGNYLRLFERALS